MTEGKRVFVTDAKIITAQAVPNPSGLETRGKVPAPQAVSKPSSSSGAGVSPRI